jgi:hypothetical protein
MAYADIKLGSTFDAKGFKQADTAVKKLEKGVKQLAGAFGLAFGAAAVVSFGKASLKAFQEDEAAAMRLSRAVENLGIGFANPAISKYIAELERSAGIADDVLRPAFQGLLTTTGSLTQSQKLLNDAITISRASGVDLATVSQDLAKGYVGSTKALAKYNTGLTKTELSTKSFSEILGVLLTKSAGAANDYLDTTAYKMDILSVATGNAQEIIGAGLVDAFARISGGTETTDAAKLIEDLATALYHVEVNAGGAIGAIPTLIQKLKKLPKEIFMGFAGAQAGVKLTPPPKVTKTALEVTKEEQAKRLAKMEADALKRAKALAAMQTKAAKNEADKAKLAKAARLLELKQINIAAALKGKISEEEKIRLQLMSAIADGDADKAEKLAKKLEDIQEKNAKIAADLLAIGEAKDPFSTWAGSLSLALEALAKLGLGMSAISTIMIPGVTYNPSQNADRNYDDKVAAAKAAAEKAAADKAAADKAAAAAAADAAAVLAAAGEKAAADKAAAAAAAAAALAILGTPGTTYNPSQNADRNYDEKAAAADAAAAAAAALATAPTNNSPGAGVTYNPSQSQDRNYDMNSNQTPTIIVNNNGSVIMQDEFVDAVNDALLQSQRSGYGRTPAGAITA